MWVAIAEQRLRAVRCARWGVLLATIVALPAFAGTASAATVSAAAASGNGVDITYQAVASETNNTTVSKPGADTWRFTEGAPLNALTAGANCTQTAVNVVTCGPTLHEPHVVVNLLDQNDTFSAAGVDFGGAANAANATINGGDGDDTLTGPNNGSNLQTLNGDNGNDTLNGGTKKDVINGGSDAGMDRMTGGDESDVLDGGPGIDRALYTTGDTTITIDNTANDSDGLGSNAENVKDTVESITGSSGKDNITGSCFSNTFAGQAGDDTLNGDPTTCGSYGGDFMGGGAGKDTMRGSLTPTSTDGVDRVTYTSNTSAQATSVTLDGTANDTDGLGATQDNVGRDIEYLYGGPEVDTFNGTSALQGVSFWTGAGNDTLIGSTFNDYFDGQAGADSQDCDGGANDMYKVDGADPAPNANCETAVP
jgi:Ca2+-binding RTX toxin-like protein